MKNRKLLYLIIGLYIFVAGITIKCATPKHALDKSGAQLWGESCGRCHNTASPATFSDVEWEVAVTHMEMRAQLTEDEAKKIFEFLKSAN